MTMIPVPSDDYYVLKDSIARLERLKESPGFHDYTRILVGEMTALFFAFSEAKEVNDILRIQGQVQSVQRILGVLDEQLVQRNQVAAAIDAQVEALRQGRDRNAPPSDRPWRSQDHALIENRG